MERYNLVVIGAGSAGLVVAAGAAGLGARVALVERGRMGGDCLNYGCVPSKALLRSAKAAAQPRRAGLGVGTTAPAVRWAEVAARVQGVIDTIAPHDSVERFTALGVEVLQGHGRLSGPRQVEVRLAAGGTRTLDAKAIVLATGSAPLVPPIPGLEETGYLTNETVFTHTELPRRLCVLGGGPIGLELGQAFARLGSQVTVVEMLPRVLPREDADAAAVVVAALEADGIALRTGRQAVRVEHGAGGKRVICRPAPTAPGAPAPAQGPEEAIEVDEILVAVGRRATLSELGLEAVGVRTEHGRLQVDARLRTSVASIYACGDCVGPYQFTHMANAQARVVIQNALLPFKTRMDYRVVPWATFTDPELARVGLSEDEARQRGVPYRAIVVPYAELDRAVCEGEREGFLKVLTPPGGDAILGATLVGAHAGELLHELVLAMRARLRLRDLSATVHIYPTLAEMFRTAGDQARKDSFTPRLQRIFRAYLRWARR
jgi:pyruvate/2-oxoglutarate dehydrogenase complex dihydrolipoamide dehydrogenase (E3) component